MIVENKIKSSHYYYLNKGRVGYCGDSELHFINNSKMYSDETEILKPY